MSQPTKWTFTVLLLLVVTMTGCVATQPVRATKFDLSLKINPERHELTGRAELTLEPLGDPFGDELICVEFDLNENLRVTNAEARGAEFVEFEQEPFWRRLFSRKKNSPRIDRLYVRNPDNPSQFQVVIEYQGQLEQDIAAGEKAGQIHNFQVSSHIGPEGTYLSPNAAWYPTPHWEHDSAEDPFDPALMLADWNVHADRVENYELVATGLRDDRSDHYHWRSPHPLTGVMITGGPHEVWSEKRGNVTINVHMQAPDTNDSEASDNQAIAKRYIDRAALYIERYEPLLGPFPYEQYTIIENFFSSGFAFPTLTLFGPAVMHMGDNAFRHGYLDHELVHSWWGCGVDVDPRDGNWCESLTSYCTNHYGHILEDDDAGARKRRRDYSNFLSRLKPKHDKPLATYGQPGGTGRGVAYSKGAAVFHMLARKIGQDAFWSACRSLTHNYLGRHANWDDLKKAFENASNQNLDTFFEQWVRGSGAPILRLVSAEYDGETGNLAVEIDQGETDFDLDVPLRVFHGDAHEDVVVNVSSANVTVQIPTHNRSTAIELDPDYHIFRKLDLTEIMPTSNTTKSAKHLTIIKPAGDLFEEYETAIEGFVKVVCKRKDAVCVTLIADDSLTADAIEKGGVLMIGDAVRHPVAQELLSRSDSPIVWTDRGFTIDGQEFNQPNQAVFCTVHNPDSSEDGITVYHGNDQPALANAALLGFYANSLLVFETDTRSEVVLRRDFESTQKIAVSEQAGD